MQSTELAPFMQLHIVQVFVPSCVSTSSMCYLYCRWSFAVGFVAFTWLMFASVVFMLPVAYPITALGFNFAPAAIGGLLLLMLVAWVMSARFWFSGPHTDVDNSDVVKVRYWISDPPRLGLRCPT